MLTTKLTLTSIGLAALAGNALAHHESATALANTGAMGYGLAVVVLVAAAIVAARGIVQMVKRLRFTSSA